MTKKQPLVVIIISICIAAFLLKKGLENKVDPLWVNTSTIASTKTIMLNDKSKALQQLFDSLHPKSKININKQINIPYPLTITWEKFKTLTDKILTEKKIIISGVAGTGKSTVIDRISLLITGNKKQIIKIDCIEGLEDDYHKNWIGQYNNNHQFKAGKLLKLFEKCKSTPLKNYILVFDDFDKIYRTRFFGEALWKELGRKEDVNNIEGYPKEIEIPENLYIISTTVTGNINKVPFSQSDYRRLANGSVFLNTPSVYQLKDYLIGKKDFKTINKDSLNLKLYYFSKINEIITHKIGEQAQIGQWSRLRKLLKKNDFKGANKYILSSLKNYSGAEKITTKDFEKINYTLKNNGKIQGDNILNNFFKQIIDFGIFSEFTVAILFALFSFLGLRRSSGKRKKTLTVLSKKIQTIEQHFYDNKIDYNVTYGNLLHLKDQINDMARKSELDYSQVNYLIHEIETSLDTLDFILEIGENNNQLIDFAKEIIGDNHITEKEYKKHLAFLKNHKSSMSKSTYRAIKQRLIRLYHKTNTKNM